MRPFIIFSIVAVLIGTVVSLFVSPSWGIVLSLLGCVLICGCTIPIIAIYRNNKPRQKTCQAIIVGTVLATVIIFSTVPLQLAFRFYEPKFDAVAATLANGETLAYPFHIGPFKIFGGGLRGDRQGNMIPYLITRETYGSLGAFVNNADGSGWNIWWLTRINNKWSLMEED